MALIVMMGSCFATAFRGAVRLIATSVVRGANRSYGAKSRLYGFIFSLFLANVRTQEAFPSKAPKERWLLFLASSKCNLRMHMAPQIPHVDSLKRPEKLSTALKSDGVDDCFSCRLIGRSDVLSVLDPAYSLTPRTLLIENSYLRCSCFDWARGLQLFLGQIPTETARSGHLAKREQIRYEI